MTDDQPDLSTLPNRMRYAANVIDAVNCRASEIQSMPPLDREWNSSSLHRWADAWKAEDRADKERKDLVTDLAKRISFWIEKKPWEVCELQIRYVDAAEDLIQNGWRKGDPE